ncbi:hypothetical protein RIF23_01460 [Lipingzhangella sp. LS1_29]|uniref:Uncharacterized protein n=1 Tax=Lipingzhangella rawalii TaxID=2055835 RepID=A0ABU2H2B4_9ACTN|nr:hypothetical protein [Lipingzhangella rawalii]MDS1268955.1 hypothetical protein [Lipingzhangella rawalii]
MDLRRTPSRPEVLPVVLVRGKLEVVALRLDHHPAQHHRDEGDRRRHLAAVGPWTPTARHRGQDSGVHPDGARGLHTITAAVY